jgi:hypothetical protein
MQARLALLATKYGSVMSNSTFQIRIFAGDSSRAGLGLAGVIGVPTDIVSGGQPTNGGPCNGRLRTNRGTDTFLRASLLGLLWPPWGCLPPCAAISRAFGFCQAQPMPSIRTNTSPIRAFRLASAKRFLTHHRQPHNANVGRISLVQNRRHGQLRWCSGYCLGRAPQWRVVD